MFRKESNEESSDNDNTFNFNYEIEIDRRKGADVTNREEMYDFGDFPDFREDRSQRSYITSQKRYLPSDIIKKSEDNDSFQDNNTEFSGKKKGGSVIEDIPPVIIEQQNQNKLEKSNKFPDMHRSYKTANNNIYQINQTGSPRLMTRTMTKNNQQVKDKQARQRQATSELKINQSHRQQIAHKSINFQIPIHQQTKQNNEIQLEDQYKNIVNKIQFYENNNDQLQYEFHKLQEEIMRLQGELQNPIYDIQTRKYTDQANNINMRIAEQKNIERNLLENHDRLEEEFMHLATSIQEMKFERPFVLKDQAKAILGQITELQRQFQGLKQNEVSLNLSSTLHQAQPPPNPASIQNRLAFGETSRISAEQMFFTQIVNQIRQADQKAKQPNFIYNMKMSIMKPEWKLFENSDFCINVSSRDYPRIDVKIGNKGLQALENFNLRQDNINIAENQKFFGKSVYNHSFLINRLSKPFIKLEITYKAVTITKNEEQHIIVFVPTLPLYHGEFIPIYHKQFENETYMHSSSLQQIKSKEYLPIDHSICRDGNLKQFQMYYPNLLYLEGRDRNKNQVKILKGIFQTYSSDTEGALVTIKQKRKLVSVQITNNSPFLLQSLEFLLGVL